MLRHPVMNRHKDAQNFLGVQTQSQQKPHYLGGSEVAMHLALHDAKKQMLEKVKKDAEIEPRDKE